MFKLVMKGIRLFDNMAAPTIREETNATAHSGVQHPVSYMLKYIGISYTNM